MNSRINEYVHAEMIIGNPARNPIIIYEILDYPNYYSNVLGTVYLDNKPAYTFFVENSIMHTLENSLTEKKHNCEILCGSCVNGVFQLAWKGDPGEHFLCVSYNYSVLDNFNDTASAVNWLQEGF